MGQKFRLHVYIITPRFACICLSRIGFNVIQSSLSMGYLVRVGHIVRYRGQM